MSKSISQVYRAVLFKRLSAVEVDLEKSHQHEFNGTKEMKRVLGTDDKDFKVRFRYLDDSGISEPIAARLKWYDARRADAERTEYRLYYTKNDILTEAQPGDSLILAINKNQIDAYVCAQGSTIEQQLVWLFHTSEIQDSFDIKDFTEEDFQLDLSAMWVLEELGFDVVEEKEYDIDLILAHFGENFVFPTTREFSAFARDQCEGFDLKGDPDNTVIAFVQREEQLFKAGEKIGVERKLKEGFGASGIDVDDFISYSLSIQNRRKSRAGYSFENHLEFIFENLGIQFSRGKQTEKKSKPDFLFPGIEYYKDAEFDENLLTMLGAKTTSKDRWRQILTEAKRIPLKHLITMEPAISEEQTEEMKDHSVGLVVPESIQASYSEKQQKELLKLGDFISLVQNNESRIDGRS